MKGRSFYEGQVFGYSFDLMEQAKDAVGFPNPMTYAVDEDALIEDDELDEILEAAEENGEDDEEAEDRALTSRGEYFAKADVLAALQAYRQHFTAHPQLAAGRAMGEQLALDLADMISTLEAGASERVRLYIA